MALRRLLIATGSAGALPLPEWQIAGAAASEASLAAVFAANLFTVTESSVVVETGYRPANGTTYNALWTRDHAYVLWHYPTLLTATQRRQFVTHRLSSRSGNVVADHIAANGTKTFLNYNGRNVWDNIAFVVLALWADWNLTGDTSTFTANQTVIDSCLAAVPRSVNGCVYSNPSSPIVDYGFTDVITKTGDCAYGTALMAWSYKMLAEISGEAPGGTYSTARAHAESGLATLRNANGFYRPSSVNCASLDDVWATALIVAEGLVSGTDRTDSAQALADAYSGGTITQNGLVRHLPTGQNWPTVDTWAVGTYQNGAYWLTPLWDCVRAVALVDRTLARSWASVAMAEVATEISASGASLAPYEWRNGGTLSTPKGYSAHAALVHRFV